MSRLLTTTELIRALSWLHDLTDPAAGPHAMQLLLAEIHAALPVAVHAHRASPITSARHSVIELRDAIYAALHRGTEHVWASPRRM